jgi:hypothetical protein
VNYPAAGGVLKEKGDLSVKHISAVLLLSAALAAMLILSAGCDKGLDPEDVQPGIDGTVVFNGGWSQDSGVHETYVIVFRNMPQDSASAYAEFLQGNVHFHQLTPSFRDSYEFHIDLDPGTYEVLLCVGIAGDNFFDLSNWILAGVYTVSGDPFQPAAVTVPEGERAGGVDITASVTAPLPLPF